MMKTSYIGTREQLEDTFRNPFACLISRFFFCQSVVFSLTINQRTVLSAITFRQTNKWSRLAWLHSTSEAVFRGFSSMNSIGGARVVLVNRLAKQLIS
jgi:hypothetical protein